VDRIAEDVAGGGSGRPALDIEAKKRGDEGDISERVDGKGHGDAGSRDEEAGRGRPDETGAVEDDGVDRDGRREGVALDEARDEREARRLRRRVGDPKDAVQGKEA